MSFGLPQKNAKTTDRNADFAFRDRKYNLFKRRGTFAAVVRLGFCFFCTHRRSATVPTFAVCPTGNDVPTSTGGILQRANAPILNDLEESTITKFFTREEDPPPPIERNFAYRRKISVPTVAHRDTS